LSLLNKVLKTDGRPPADDVSLGVSHPHQQTPPIQTPPAPNTSVGDTIPPTALVQTRAELQLLVLAVEYPSRFTDVSKSFGRRGEQQQLVLDDISLDVEAGSFVTLLGASGCGKSTLLNLVAGLDKPSAGTIEVPGGRPALMFQEHA